MKTCIICNNYFENGNARAKTCGDECRAKHKKNLDAAYRAGPQHERKPEDEYFWSLVRPRAQPKPRPCMKCRKVIGVRRNAYSVAHICVDCQIVNENLGALCL